MESYLSSFKFGSKTETDGNLLGTEESTDDSEQEEISEEQAEHIRRRYSENGRRSSIDEGNVK